MMKYQLSIIDQDFMETRFCAMENQTSLIDILTCRGINQQDQKIYAFLDNGKIETASLTYGELHRRAQAIAARLQTSGVAQGERALLLYANSLEFVCAFFGCLYAGIIAIPTPSPDSIRLKRTLPRIYAFFKDAQVSAVLTTAKTYSQFPPEWQKDFSEQNITSIFTEEISDTLATEWCKKEIRLDNVAYLQYTSGSTSAPKGVMVTHKNMMHHSAYIQQAWNYTSDSIAVTWMPYFHDYGLIDGLIQPLYSGITCYIMSPLTFIRKPICWLEAISRFNVTHTQSPNFGYEYCIRKITSKQLTNIDLSSWKIASNGAEPIRKDTLENFIDKFKPYGFSPSAFYPAYGLAEATLLVSTKPHGETYEVASLDASKLEKNQVFEHDSEPSFNKKITRHVVSCGFPICGMTVVIADPKTLTKCASNEVGEIWIQDQSVTQGYWNKPTETKQTFGAYLRDTNEGPFLRTGDLGFFKNGQLFITGRLKDVIIIRGHNHYPQDIEFTVEKSHPSLRENSGAAFGVEISNREKLVVVQEVKRNWVNTLNLEEVIGDIRQELMAHHELQVYAVALIKSGSIPKTSSGKIMRRTCRTRFIEGTLDVINVCGSDPQSLRKLTVMSAMRSNS